MANEINYEIRMSMRNGDILDTFASGSKAADQAAAALVRNVQTVPTTAAGTELDLASVVTPGWSLFMNVDDTNFIEIGAESGGTFYPLIKLLKGEMFAGRLGVAPYARSNTAAVKLFYIVYEE